MIDLLRFLERCETDIDSDAECPVQFPLITVYSVTMNIECKYV